jgi:rhomboid protease GluP
LIGLLILSFAGSYLYGDGPTDLDTARLFGSMIPADATTDNFIRTMTYIFHQIGGPIHLLLNLSAIAVTGPFIERVYGPFKYTILFLFTGIFGGTRIL